MCVPGENPDRIFKDLIDLQGTAKTALKISIETILAPFLKLITIH